MPTNGIVILLVIAAAIYFIVRQFIEQPVSPRALLIFPGLILYYTYTNIQQELAHPALNPVWIIGSLVVGLLPGVLLGVLRGRLAVMRYDQQKATVYVRPGFINIVIWV